MIAKTKDQFRPYKVDLLNKAIPINSSPTAHIGISTRNPRHQGEKLRTLLDWTSQRYEQVDINVHDSLQKYNYQISRNCTLIEAHTLAIEEGNQWIKANQPILEGYKNVALYHHDELIKKVPHSDRVKYLQDLYASNSSFADLIDNESVSLAQRKEKRGEFSTPQLRDNFFHYSRLYILDELALMSLLNEREQYVEFYAGRFLKILKNPERHRIEGLPDGLKNYPLIEVDFIRAPHHTRECKAA